jgi:CubicO group peptidase (beta-lactamase class C family)
MLRKSLLLSAGLAMLTHAALAAEQGQEDLTPKTEDVRKPDPPSERDSTEDLTAKLEAIRKVHDLPALAAAAMYHGKLVENAATGVRKLGETDWVTTDDKWHIGSCTKSMTATLAAMFVDEGKLEWNTTVADVFPELRHTMCGNWNEVTLEQLLTHLGGAPLKPPRSLWYEALQQNGTPMDQRYNLLRGLFTRPLAAPRGSRFIYSNEGYAIAGAMIERVTGRAWEDLMRERIFEPLGMTSAGFGAPASVGKVDQPWGHSGGMGELRPVPPGPDADNPPAIGPAATVHCSLADLARYASWHAGWEHGGKMLLSYHSFDKLHQATAGQEYGMGWLVQPRDWADGMTFWHTGSNAMFFAVMWVAPEKDAVFVAATNAAHEEADDACNDAVVAMIHRVLGRD